MVRVPVSINRYQQVDVWRNARCMLLRTAEDNRCPRTHNAATARSTASQRYYARGTRNQETYGREEVLQVNVWQVTGTSAVTNSAERSNQLAAANRVLFVAA